MRLGPPHLLPLAALASLAVLPAADAQRRMSSDPVGGTDIQLIGEGLGVNGVGLRFWISPQTALALRADVDYARLDRDGGNDASTLGLGLGLTLENHAYRQSRVHPFVSGGLSVRHTTVDNAADEESATTFGVEAALGAEARLMQGLTLSGQYGARLGYTTGARDYTTSAGDFPNGDSDNTVLVFGLGGVPRLALSLRF